MTGPYRTARDTEAVILDTAWAIYKRAHADTIARQLETTDDLAGTIETYDLILSDTIHPAQIWPDLKKYPHQAREAGLRRAASNMLRALGVLLDQAPWLAGDQ